MSEKLYKKIAKSLDEWLQYICKDKQDADATNYSFRYKSLLVCIMPILKDVEKGALLISAKKAIEELIRNPDSERNDFVELASEYPLIYLNDHGPDHISKVVKRASELCSKFSFGHLTDYEVFILLCAIMVHDVGNLYGRDAHEKKIKDILNSVVDLRILDVIEKDIVEKIAKVHGGKINNSKDTISSLQVNQNIFGQHIRPQLLAAILRFADELADDSSRADKVALEKDLIPDESKIFHFYSKSLHSVMIINNEIDASTIISLEYYLPIEDLKKVFNDSIGQKYLLEEIYQRTLKVEKERRYCMRFFNRYLHIDKVNIEIVIAYYTNNVFNEKKIIYTLKENGYPMEPQNNAIKEFFSEVEFTEEILQKLCIGENI